EPTAKTLKYLRQFDFFDQKKLDDKCIEFVDLGDILRMDGLEKAIALLMGHVKRFKPSFVIIDSFKVFEDLAKSREEMRKFIYEIAINLMAWDCTSLLLGEFSQNEIETNPLFSIVDGIITLKHHSESGEEQRFIQISKMRGTNHSRDEHTFTINSSGLEIYAPRVTIRREPGSDRKFLGDGPVRAKTGIPTLDAVLGEGIPWGSSVLISGVAGSGKTILCLEFIYRGAVEFGDKGIFFSFEETPDRLITAAHGMGWELDEQIKKGNIEIVFVPQTEILVERDLLMMKEKIEKMGAKRVAIDSVSVFVHKIQTSQAIREKIFQIATLVQMAQAVGFFVTDIYYGENQISRFGVEEAVVDGVVVLSAIDNNFTRERFIEIYKLRNTAHISGRRKMIIERGGIKILPLPAPVNPKGKS
ncbi:MAG: ATPase domain-containing protein, partial [Pseudobdellovibrionaceae bacterium]